MLKSVVGHSNDPDSLFAIQDVLDQCLLDLGTDIPQAGILFAAPNFEHGLILQHIQHVFPGMHLIGGTTDGEISSVMGFQEDSLTLLLFCSDEVEFYAAVGRHVSQDPIAIAQATAAGALAKLTRPPQLCITIPESLTTSGVAILEGLKQGLGQKFPIIGGTTGDQWKFQCTYQFFGQEVLSDTVPILLLAGNFLFGQGVSSGWTPVGKKSLATKVQGNTLYEVDGQPVLEFYRDYLGDIRPSLEYRLAVFEPNSSHWYMRSANGSFNQENGSINFFADIPEGAQVQVVEANRDHIVSAAQTSMLQALQTYPGRQPTTALFFSCTGRMRVLGTRTKEEYEIAKACADTVTTCCGFYTYGEIGPLQTGRVSQFHNETFITLVLGTC
jgi:hypothetical protein